MNYNVPTVYHVTKPEGETEIRSVIPILNAPDETTARLRAIQHVRSTTFGLVGGVIVGDAQPMNCQGCGE